MAKSCIFCGEEIGAFSGRKLNCGGYGENVCAKCFETYCGLDGAALAEKILATGRASHAEEIREYLNERIQREQEALEREKEREEEFLIRHPETGKCPKCGGSMHQYGPITIKLGEESVLFSDIHRLMSGSLSVRADRCRDCGYTEFYTPDEEDLLQDKTEPAEEDRPAYGTNKT